MLQKDGNGDMIIKRAPKEIKRAPKGGKKKQALPVLPSDRDALTD